MTSFLTKEELEKMCFKSCGKNVLISRKASFYGVRNIEIGDNVRIDDFCILSGNVRIGSNVHIAAYSALYGADAGIYLEDFANISARVCIYALSDDFSGQTMTNPMVPDKYKHVVQKTVKIGRHAIIGTGSTLLPGAKIQEGAAVGAMSLVKSAVDPWTIVAGIPAVKVKERDRTILELEKEYLSEQ